MCRGASTEDKKAGPFPEPLIAKFEIREVEMVDEGGKNMPPQQLKLLHVFVKEGRSKGLCR